MYLLLIHLTSTALIWNEEVILFYVNIYSSDLLF